jgi:hypothetical protein
MYIKIYTRSQLVLLRQLNTMLGKYQIPGEILEEADKLLDRKKLGRSGFIAVMIEPLTDSVEEVKMLLNCYPKRIEVSEHIRGIPIKQEGLWLTKRKEWYRDCWKVAGEQSNIYTIYPIKLRKYYDE